MRFNIRTIAPWGGKILSFRNPLNMSDRLAPTGGRA